MEVWGGGVSVPEQKWKCFQYPSAPRALKRKTNVFIVAEITLPAQSGSDPPGLMHIRLVTPVASRISQEALIFCLFVWLIAPHFNLNWFTAANIITVKAVFMFYWEMCLFELSVFRTIFLNSFFFFCTVQNRLKLTFSKRIYDAFKGEMVGQSVALKLWGWQFCGCADCLFSMCIAWVFSHNPRTCGSGAWGLSVVWSATDNPSWSKALRSRSCYCLHCTIEMVPNHFNKKSGLPSKIQAPIHVLRGKICVCRLLMCNFTLDSLPKKKTVSKVCGPVIWKLLSAKQSEGQLSLMSEATQWYSICLAV